MVVLGLVYLNSQRSYSPYGTNQIVATTVTQPKTYDSLTDEQKAAADEWLKGVSSDAWGTFLSYLLFRVKLPDALAESKGNSKLTAAYLEYFATYGPPPKMAPEGHNYRPANSHVGLLHHAISQDHGIDVIRWLVERQQVDVNAMSGIGMPLAIAIRRGDEEVIEYLRSVGAGALTPVQMEINARNAEMRQRDLESGRVTPPGTQRALQRADEAALRAEQDRYGIPRRSN